MSDMPEANQDSPTSHPKRLLKVLKGEPVDRPPIWLMRQAGRYLPEYRAVRAEAGSFLDLCYDPEKACEVTHQPLRRYPLDAAILFADILLLPQALGLKLEFLEGEGPKLEPVTDAASLARLTPEKLHEHLAPVYETVRRLKGSLDPSVTLIGFAGAPWTVATYMLGGKGPAGQDAARLWGYRHPDLFAELLDILAETTADYLSAQIEAGAEVVQIFDSWAGGVPDHAFRDWIIAPTKTIVDRLQERHPGVPVIGFPRAVGPFYAPFVRETGVAAVSLDTGLDPAWARDHLQTQVAVQGNLDPMALVAGGDALKSETMRLLDCFGHGRYIFNLGHGIVPQTPPEHVGALGTLLSEWAERKSERESRG